MAGVQQVLTAFLLVLALAIGGSRVRAQAVSRGDKDAPREVGAELLRWLHSHGVRVSHLRVRHSNATGFGLEAAEKVERGTPIVNVPESVMMTPG